MRIRDWKIAFSVGLGGMLGAVGRYAISIAFPADSIFPFATLIANLVGCFLLSFLMHLKIIKKRLSPAIFTALTVGLIGAFTTFSTLSLETISLWSEIPILAIGYVFISVIAGLACCFLGLKLAYRLERSSV
ncbi:camphor resistance protein CrcB [Oceanobacillus picturae]|jgi:fluoride exporter|uniref:Fluoride-specific ion channel FluC n=2 Tax=Oceanobacillus picturae TaxID=171693 RepID=W9B9H8_9BACI|nr:CrcB family protein [Oceanobacillus picturae]RIU94596.1 CrcB family protein [Oceanobacillus picturae]CDO03160.1 camphor resistance protein CrcB [Oceanobacillus picturae]